MAAKVKKKKFSTGANRSTDREGMRYDLIDATAMRRLAITCNEGAVKYGEDNWLKGFPVNDILNHALAHIFSYLDGDRSEDHLAHAMWNLQAAIKSEESWPQLNIRLNARIRTHFGYTVPSEKPIVNPNKKAKKNANSRNGGRTTTRKARNNKRT